MDKTAIQIAAIYIALLVFGVIPLLINVIRLRRTKRIGLGDGGNQQMLRAMRMHANYSETAPFGLALLIMLPQLSAPLWIIHSVGLCMVLGRIAHAVGLFQSTGSSGARVAGMALTFTAFGIGGLGLLWRALN